MQDGLNYIADENSQILILGLFPSEITLEICKQTGVKDDYYLNFSNRFWEVIKKVIPNTNETTLKTINEKGHKYRKNILLQNGIALWDIIKSCEKTKEKSSSNSTIVIETAVPNNISEFLAKHKNIKCVCFNGQDAYKDWCNHLDIKIHHNRKPEWKIWYDKFKPWLLKEYFPNIKFEQLDSTSPSNNGNFNNYIPQWENVLNEHIIKPTKNKTIIIKKSKDKN